MPTWHWRRIDLHAMLKQQATNRFGLTPPPPSAATSPSAFETEICALQIMLYAIRAHIFSSYACMQSERCDWGSRQLAVRHDSISSIPSSQRATFATPLEGSGFAWKARMLRLGFGASPLQESPEHNRPGCYRAIAVEVPACIAAKLSVRSCHGPRAKALEVRGHLSGCTDGD